MTVGNAPNIGAARNSAALLSKIEIVGLHIFLAGDMLLASRFYEFIGFWIRSPIFYVTVACLLLFLVRVIERSYIPELCVFAILCILMVTEALHFAAISRQPENFNTFGQYYTIVSFIVFSAVIGAGAIEYLLATIFRYTGLYVIGFTLASLAVQLHIMPGELQARLTQSDPERGARILIVSSAVLYCMYYGYFTYVSTRRPYFATMFILSLIALFISQSRLLIVVVLIVWLVAATVQNRSVLSIFSFSAFLVISAGMLFGMVDLQWNPFDLFGGDTSALIRTHGYESVRQVLTAYPLLGAGISANGPDMVAFTANPTLSAADLGPIGIWFVFGLVGLIFYVASVYVQCVCTRYGGCGSRQNNKAVQHTACVIGLFGCLTPTWFNGSIVGLFFALYLRQRTSAQTVSMA